MSKITVITDAAGKIVVMGHGHLSQATARMAGSNEIQGGVRAGPGETLHEIDVQEDIGNVATWSELHDKVRPHVP